MTKTDYKMILLFILIVVGWVVTSKAKANPPMWIVRESIIQQDIAYPDYVFSQYILETGWGKHIKGNNLWGFNNGKHMEFTTWQESVRYYKKWQSKRYKGKRSWWKHIYEDWKAPDMKGYLIKVRWIYRRVMG